MLTEERYKLILDELEKNSVVHVKDLVNLLETSETTIRRDLNSLHKKGKLKKVHGGATILNKEIKTKDDKVAVRKNVNVDEKINIAKFAASIIEKDDFVYIDAGTTTELMIEFIEENDAVFVTNGIEHGKKLIHKGLKAFILGGEIKETTEAVIGVEAINSLKKYNFTKGFFGVNGIDKDKGYTTPDIKEALVKKEALSRCKKAYILSDLSKFNEVSCVTFGEIKEANIITTKLKDNYYRKLTKVQEVQE